MRQWYLDRLADMDARICARQRAEQESRERSERFTADIRRAMR